MKGVLAGFLGTYMSRYSDYDGYWLFGFLVKDFPHLSIDLLSNAPPPPKNTPYGTAVLHARTKFQDQVAKVGLSLEVIRAAELDITRLSSIKMSMVNSHWLVGYEMLFKARAVMDYGRVYELQQSVFVWPHNPSIESRSGRAG